MKAKTTKKIFYSDLSRGFTIVEMLIAVFIFTVAISALTFMAGNGIRSARQSQSRIVAEYLATEGMEVIRNVRDSAFLSGLSGATWEAVFGTDIVGPGGCFSPLNEEGEPVSCNFSYNLTTGVPELGICSSNCALYLDPSTKVYSYDSGNPTPYTREIFIEEISPAEIRVRVRVEWDGDFIEYQENLYLWG
jgi:prepilin-type N-terminal cleavage/methylation domain-containing protein